VARWHFDTLDEEIQLIFGNPQSVDQANHVLVARGGDRFELTEVPEGTLVRVTRPPYVPDEEWSAYDDDITEGWTSFLQQLKFMHEVHPGEERRTIFVMARGSADGLPTLLSRPPVELGAPLVLRGPSAGGRAAFPRPWAADHSSQKTGGG
jgi:hypothetical protein